VTEPSILKPEGHQSWLRVPGNCVVASVHVSKLSHYLATPRLPRDLEPVQMWRLRINVNLLAVLPVVLAPSLASIAKQSRAP